MKIGLFIGRERGLKVLEYFLKSKEEIAVIFCLVEDKQEEPVYRKIVRLAEKNKIPLYLSNQTSPPSYASLLKKHRPELVFVINWRQIIPKENFSLPPRGIFVVHDSLLPKYRGFAPLNWAIINGEKNTGATLFRIIEGMDAGDILDQIKIPIGINDTAAILDKKMVEIYSKLVEKNFLKIKKGKFVVKPQNHALATYTCKRTPDDGKINWASKTVDIYNLIRGLTKPYPGAYAFFNGKKMVIWRAKLVRNHPKYVGRIPGRVVRILKNQGVWVLTGDGLIEINQIQIDKSKLQTADRILKSIKHTLS